MSWYNSNLIIPCVAAFVIIIFLIIENLRVMTREIKREKRRNKLKKELDKVLRNKRND